MAELLRVVAKREAERIRDTYSVRDLNEVAKQMGITVMYRAMFGDLSGAIIKRAGEDPEILINSLEPPVRQRFTLAHEIGHFIERTEIAKDEDFSFEDHRSTAYDAHEFFADEFAGNLLMPEHEVRDEQRENKSIVEMANRFNVSVSAMQRRLKNLEKWKQADGDNR